MITESPRVFRAPTADLSDPNVALSVVDYFLPATAIPTPTVAVLDLRGKLLSASSAQVLVTTIGRRLTGGDYGQLRVILAVSDDATREVLRLVARAHGLPLFVTVSPDPSDVQRAEPIGDLTSSEADTLEHLRSAGWYSTVASLAERIGVEASAANNRLVNLERKGFVYRISRHRRQGDLYLDPRAPEGLDLLESPPPPLAALEAAGVTTDPYDVTALTLDGAAAETAAAVLRRRGKAT